jgi:hypothetical protein
VPQTRAFNSVCPARDTGPRGLLGVHHYEKAKRRGSQASVGLERLSMSHMWLCQTGSVLLVVVLWLVRSVYFKIVMSTLQQNAIALSYAFDWDGFSEKMLQAQGTVTSFGMAYVDFRCLNVTTGNTFVLESLFYICFPLVLVVLVFLVALAASQKHGQDAPQPELQPDPASDIRPVAYRAPASVARIAGSERWQSASDSSIGVGTVLLFLLQPTLVNRFALVLSCVRMGSSPDDMYLAENLDLRCWKEDHMKLLLGLGLPLLLLYVVGVPCLVLYTLCKSENRARVFTITSKLQQSTQVRTRNTEVLDSTSVKQVETSPEYAQGDTPAEKTANVDPVSADVAPARTAMDPSKSHVGEKNTKSVRDRLRWSVHELQLKNLSTETNQPVLFDKETQAFHRNFSFLFLGYKVRD